MPYTVYTNNIPAKLKKDPNFNLSAANGTTIATYGTRLFNVDLGLRRQFSHCFILAAVNRPIIGADFLSKFGLLVDLKNRRLVDTQTSLTVNAIETYVNTVTPINFTVESEYGTILKNFLL